MYIFISIYIYLYVYMYINIYIHIYICICTYINKYTCTLARWVAHVYVCMRKQEDRGSGRQASGIPQPLLEPLSYPLLAYTTTHRQPSSPVHRKHVPTKDSHKQNTTHTKDTRHTHTKETHAKHPRDSCKTQSRCGVACGCRHGRQDQQPQLPTPLTAPRTQSPTLPRL